MQQENLLDGIQGVIFDLDGVLVDSERIAYNIWCDLVGQYGKTLDEAGYASAIGTSQEETAMHIMRLTGLNFDVDEICAWAWQELGNRISAGIEPLPGVLPLIQGLAEAGYPLAIASNGISGYVTDTLRGAGLIDFFPIRVCIDEVETGKPAPDVYLGAAEKLGVDPRRCLGFEDSRVGVQAAHSAGLKVIVVPGPSERGEKFPGAWKMYPSLVEVVREIEPIRRTM